MTEKQLYDRALYKKVKGMDRAAMEQRFKNMYQIGYEAALKEGAVELNTDKFRAKIGQIKGIGENRLNDIMAVTSSDGKVDLKDANRKTLKQLL